MDQTASNFLHSLMRVRRLLLLSNWFDLIEQHVLHDLTHLHVRMINNNNKKSIVKTFEKSSSARKFIPYQTVMFNAHLKEKKKKKKKNRVFLFCYKFVILYICIKTPTTFTSNEPSERRQLQPLAMATSHSYHHR